MQYTDYILNYTTHADGKHFTTYCKCSIF